MASKRILALLLLTLISTFQPGNADSRYPLIISGQDAKQGAWPWMAALIRKNAFSDYDGQYCGGAFIAPRWVVTAAHCLLPWGAAGVAGPYVPDVVVGRVNLLSTEGYRIAAKRAIIHPAFDWFTLENDIGLIELSEAVPAATLNIPGQIFDSAYAKGGSTATALGWGATSRYGFFYPVDLQQVELSVVDNDTCNAAVGPGINDGMLCAGPTTGMEDTCYGDSGGPLVHRSPLSGTWTLIGITSFGFGSYCATPGTYGGYTRVAYYSQWISDTICGAPEIPAAPAINVASVGTHGSVSFPTTVNTTGYHLYFAPALTLAPIDQVDMGENTYLSARLEPGTDIKIAVRPYNHACQGPFSNIERIQIP